MADDLFAVSELRLQVLDAGKGISEHASYLRSRIRLLRALTTLIPALIISYAIYGLIGEKKPGWQNLRLVGTGGLFLIYGSVFLYKTSDWVKSRWRNKCRDVPPKTYFDPEKYRDKQIFLQRIKEHLGKRWALRDPVLLGLWILIILSAFLEFSKEKISTFWILPFLGLALTLVCGWAFLRVHKTFLSLIDDYHEYVKRQHLPADASNPKADR